MLWWSIVEEKASAMDFRGRLGSFRKRQDASPTRRPPLPTDEAMLANQAGLRRYIARYNFWPLRYIASSIGGADWRPAGAVESSHKGIKENVRWTLWAGIRLGVRRTAGELRVRCRHFLGWSGKVARWSVWWWQDVRPGPSQVRHSASAR